MNVSRILKKGKALVLTYDHGLEHGPEEFDENTVDPEHAFDLALEGGFSAIATHIGVAEKYYHGPYRDVPLIVKVNGSTRLPHINPISNSVCSVERAVKAGAAAIGFTIYDGSPNEPEMFREFGAVCEEAHDYGLPVIAWMYPRGPGIRSTSNEVLAYAARIGLELGADAIKIHYNQDVENLKWMTACAGRTSVIVSGIRAHDTLDFLNQVKAGLDAGAVGVATGRAVWKHGRPYSLAKALREIVYAGKTPLETVQFVR